MALEVMRSVPRGLGVYSAVLPDSFLIRIRAEVGLGHLLGRTRLTSWEMCKSYSYGPSNEGSSVCVHVHVCVCTRKKKRLRRSVYMKHSKLFLCCNGSAQTITLQI